MWSRTWALHLQTMGFATKVWLGEHLGWCGRNWSSVFEMVPQDVAQCVYNGKNTGVGSADTSEYVAHAQKRQPGQVVWSMVRPLSIYTD